MNTQNPIFARNITEEFQEKRPYPTVKTHVNFPHKRELKQQNFEERHQNESEN